jgi:hypothetical protein
LAAAAKNVRKWPRQAQDILATLPQRRQAQLDDVQAVEQILAEAAGAHVGFEVAVGGGEDADVGVARLGLADALELALLQEAQQLGLQAGRDLADLVEQQGAAVSGLDAAGLIAHRAGESTARVAEQLAGEQLLGQGRAVDGDERARGARAAGVERPRQHALARPFSPRSSTVASDARPAAGRRAPSASPARCCRDRSPAPRWRAPTAARPPAAPAAAARRPSRRRSGSAPA